MTRLKEKLGYMVSALNRSIIVAEKNPLSQDAVNAMFLAVTGVIFGSIMLIL